MSLRYQFILIVVVAATVCAAGSLQARVGETIPVWLERVNFYRAAARLPPVTEAPHLSADLREHARYIVMHDDLRHAQDRRRRWATAAGAAAAASSNLAASTRAAESETWAVDLWMQGPFHALGVLDPALAQVGFAMHSAANGRIQTAAGLDVIRGRAPSPVAAPYPIVWPADGATVPLVAHTTEYPDPLASCPGYRAPTGLPLIVQLGSGGNDPVVARTWLLDGHRSLDHCVFDERSYRNGDREAQALGRSVLAARDAIVLIPRAPLEPGRRYRAVIKVNDLLIDWSFSTAE